MAGLTDAAMVIGAAAIKAAITHLQLHTAAPGGSGTSNVATSARLAVTWGSTTGAGDWDLASALDFTGGAASGPIHSVTGWSASSGGTFLGVWLMTGDTAFNATGKYRLTSLSLDGSAT
jgi:hypothetical protein